MGRAAKPARWFSRPDMSREGSQLSSNLTLSTSAKRSLNDEIHHFSPVPGDLHRVCVRSATLCLRVVPGSFAVQIFSAIFTIFDPPNEKNVVYHKLGVNGCVLHAKYDRPNVPADGLLPGAGRELSRIGRQDSAEFLHSDFCTLFISIISLCVCNTNSASHRQSPGGSTYLLSVEICSRLHHLELY